jgi:hypothetical protein
MLKKLHLPAVLAFGGQLVNLAVSPVGAALMPAHWSLALGATLAAAQAITKAVHHGKN